MGKNGRRVESERKIKKESEGDRCKETERNTEEAGIFLVPCGFLNISFRS